MGVNFIIGHWTGGNYTPCPTDIKSYQTLIDGNGGIHNGAQIGKAASTGGMNSITFNISCCGGLAHTPIKPVQFEAFCLACAKKIKELNLQPDKFYTHAEIGEMCKNKTITRLLPMNSYLKQNIGKIDLTKLPTLTGTPKETGDFIRNKIKWYLTRL